MVRREGDGFQGRRKEDVYEDWRGGKDGEWRIDRCFGIIWLRKR